ncbi:hypothetical protein, partial [Desulfurobacterium sp.]|uniref:hypothetical protein n=1 Tax=Desulfurobacterium sp. TaxID=2004706 RepID=UPI00260F9B50
MKPARSGIALIEVIMALMIGTALVFIGIYEIERYKYLRDMEKGINTMNILYRDLRVLESKAKDVDGDGYYEPLKETSTEEIPNTVSVQKNDLWGNPIKYCTWDLGRKNTVDPDYSDNNQPPPVSGLTIRLISAGSNGVFDTNCDDTEKQEDDLVVDGYQDETKLVALG